MSSSMSLSIAASSSSSSSSSSRNWVYDVFPSFSGEDVRVAFLSHFLKELDRKLIVAFKDSEIERSRSLDPELKQAIKDSRIAVVVFSKNYASSSWCLNELLEIVKCKKEFGQMVIPVFYGLDPSHVRKQTGDFGKIFEETCKNITEEVKLRWRKALTDVANILGYHSMTWGNEATMIEVIANDVLSKLLLTPSRDFEEFVGIEDHFAQMSDLLRLESEEVRMIGIWGPSGIGKTTIARALFNQLSRRFQGNIYIDGAFISKSMEIYRRANPDDYNIKLDLQRNLLSQISGKKDIQIHHLGAVEGRLNHQKVLIVIDDLDDQVVLDALVGKTQWFGCGSRIIVVTKDKQFLRAHDIDQIYKVCLPSEEQALRIFCQSAFRQDSPPDGFMIFALEVVRCAGSLPLGLNVLGSYIRGRGKEDWMDMLPSLLNRLNGKIEKTLRVSYDGLDNKNDAAIFRHIACIFNGETVDDIKMLLADSNLDVNIGLKILIDKSLIYVHKYENTVEMHSLLQEMGKEIVREQSDEPGEREFLMDSKDICDVLEEKSGTKEVLGIALDMDKIYELHLNESSFKGMRNLLFLKIYNNKFSVTSPENKVRLPERFDYFPPKLRLLSWQECPLRCLPSNFRLANLVKVQLHKSQLEKLWEGVHPLPRLKTMDLSRSKNLKEIPDVSMVTNLETLDLDWCSSVVELPFSIQYLNKPTELDMQNFCKLESLDRLYLSYCSWLKTFPDISRNISELDVGHTDIEEVPWWIEKFTRLAKLWMYDCKKLQRVSLNLLKLKHLVLVDFRDCRALAEASFNDSRSEVAMGRDNILSNLQVSADEVSSSLPHDDFSVVSINFMNCFNFDPKALIQQQIIFMELIIPGEEVPSYFTHRTSGTSLNNIPLPQASLSQRFFRFRGCTVVEIHTFGRNPFEIQVCCRFLDRDGNHFDSTHRTRDLISRGLFGHMVIIDCCFPLAEQFNYDHVDIQFHLTVDVDDSGEIKGCGIKLHE